MNVKVLLSNKNKKKTNRLNANNEVVLYEVLLENALYIQLWKVKQNYNKKS